MGVTLVQPAGYHAGKCGYCSPPGKKKSAPQTSYSLGLVASQMSAQFYQNLCDRGWRRSGDYVYHPDMARTCCPQYTIRLDVSQFKPTRQQRSAVNRWNRFVSTGLKPGEEVLAGGVAAATENAASGKKGKGKGKGKDKAKPFDLVTELRSHQAGYGAGGGEAAPKHRFELELTPAKVTQETFELYKRYQVAVHKDAPGSVSRAGYKGFLCTSPLDDDEEIVYTNATAARGLPTSYGGYHLLYRVDGVLVGVSVIDILPHAVSSVYFMWDRAWAWAGLGKLSALYEIALVRDMAAAGAKDMAWLYMGYWIATCGKMRYKGEYHPSYLLDPGTQVFHPLTPRLDKGLARIKGYKPFEEIEAMAEDEVAGLPEPTMSERIEVDEDVGGGRAGGGDDDNNNKAEFPTPPPPGFLDPASLSAATMDSLVTFLSEPKHGIVPYKMFQHMLTPRGRVMVKQMVAALGLDMVASLVDQKFEDKAFLYFGD